MANASDSLRIYDISESAQPTRIAQTNNGGNAFGLALSGNLLYLACDHDGLRIYDIANPANPVYLGQATNDDVIPHSTAVALSGNYAFLADANRGLRACDISAPASPLERLYVPKRSDQLPW